MKVAVASVDGVSISHHFGRSQCFIVFDVDGENVGDSTVRPNTFTAHGFVSVALPVGDGIEYSLKL